MIKKKILNDKRIRRISGGFSFIPHRFLTDGFLEAMDDDQQPLGEENICNIIQSYANKDASSIMDRLEEEIRKYSSGIQQDDATGIIVKILH